MTKSANPQRKSQLIRANSPDQARSGGGTRSGSGTHERSYGHLPHPHRTRRDPMSLGKQQKQPNPPPSHHTRKQGPPLDRPGQVTSNGVRPIPPQGPRHHRSNPPHGVCVCARNAFGVSVVSENVFGHHPHQDHGLKPKDMNNIPRNMNVTCVVLYERCV